MIIAADNLQVVNPAVAGALESLDAAPIQAMVRQCVQAGAQVLDVNCGPLPKMAEQRMAFLVQAVRAVTDVPLMLDTTNPRALAAGLPLCGSRPIVNGFSLEPARRDAVLPLARQYDADIVGYLLHPDNRVPMEEDEMMALAVELFDACRAAGVDPARLIVDPVIAPLSWQDATRHNRAALAVIRHLPDLLGTRVRTIAGLSNLASGRLPAARKIALERTFLPMLAAAGLDMVLLNVLHEETVAAARTCDMLLGEKIFA
jgi:5-methyltetrahydrofolate corrinoid/iron sulfur protein methyltransferase